jgi:hypothetical protein
VILKKNQKLNQPQVYIIVDLPKKVLTSLSISPLAQAPQGVVSPHDTPRDPPRKNAPIPARYLSDPKPSESIAEK